MIKNVRVLTLPYLEFEFCNVYRGTFGKTLPLIHRHPDAVVTLWNDYDHVFFLTVAQLLPCLQDMQADHWSMIVFWNEAKGQAARKGPDVGLDFTDQPTPAPEVPQQPPNSDDVDMWTIQVMRIRMLTCLWTMPTPPSQQPEPDLDNDPIELGSGGDPPAPPGGGTDSGNNDGGHPPGTWLWTFTRCIKSTYAVAVTSNTDCSGMSLRHVHGAHPDDVSEAKARAAHPVVVV
ncbi:GIP, partial [Symbiodinium microadriaticum]